LIKCIRMIKDEKILLIFIGPMLEKNREYISKLEDYVKKNNLEKKILFLGEQKNVNEYMIAADLFVFASKKEGFPNTIVEAITSGLPIISTEFEPLDDFINENIGTIIKNNQEFNNSTSMKFAKAITTIRNNSSLYNRQEIRNTGIKKFSAKKIDAEYNQIYKQL
jgi:glycosyltransferase involved in cell wall biosynthesis